MQRRQGPIDLRIASLLVLLVALASAPALAQPSVAGDWVLSFQELSGPNITRLSLAVNGDKVTARAMGRTLEGTLRDSALELKSENVTLKGRFEGGTLAGEAAFEDRTVKWTAVRAPSRPAQPKTHVFEPTAFHRYFSSKIEPVLHVQPGDTVRTWSVDAGGHDKTSTRRSAGGNPQTGPFYVEGAVPGDTLVVRLNRVRLNRDWAESGSTIMSNALDSGSVASLKWDEQFETRWTLDAARSVAFLAKPTDRLKKFTVPIQPMLGCVAVAPQGESTIRTSDSGRFGGNMDYNQIREGTTLYLPIYHPGALLFVGDGHAAQGDGELTGDALETSMDVEFTVDVIPGQRIDHPRAENAEFLISIGIGGSLDQALQQATSGMVRWLDRDYGLGPSESAVILGFAVKYDIVDLVGTQVSIAARIPKSALAEIPKKQAG